jgi:hypothetical protein
MRTRDKFILGGVTLGMLGGSVLMLALYVTDQRVNALLADRGAGVSPARGGGHVFHSGAGAPRLAHGVTLGVGS